MNIKKQLISLVAAVVMAQAIDFIWFSGMLPFQSHADRDFNLMIMKDLILAFVSVAVYETFYEAGADMADVFEFAFLFTIMHFCLDEKPLITSQAELYRSLIDCGHSLVLLFGMIFSAYQARRFARKAGI